jgi:hypothetical protein
MMMMTIALLFLLLPPFEDKNGNPGRSFLGPRQNRHEKSKKHMRTKKRRMANERASFVIVDFCYYYLLAATSFSMNNGDTVVLNMCYNVRLMLINGQIWNSFFVIVVVVITLLWWWIHDSQ